MAIILRPHQVAPSNDLSSILGRYQAAVDFSDCGVGKTYVATSVIKKLNLPTLVVGPKISEAGWRRAAEAFDDKVTYLGYEKLATGRTPLGQWQHQPPAGKRNGELFVCQSCQREVDFDNYTPCYCHPIGAHCIVIKKKPWKYGRFLFSPAVKMIVFDEVHRCSGLDSLNAEMLIAARRQGIKILGLSATAANSPLQMRALGYALDLHTLTESAGCSFWRWARHYGCEMDQTFGGFRWNVGKDEQREIMARLNAEIIPARGVRVRCDDIPDFPKLDVEAELYTVEDPEELSRLFKELQEAMERHNKTRATDRDPEGPLTKMLRARQKIELLKTPIVMELAQDYLAKGYSVPIFVNYSETVELLRKKLGFPVIDGSVVGEARNKILDAFKRDEHRGLIVNIMAGGVSVDMQDVRGIFPRMGLVMPNPSAIAMLQVFGRLRRDGGKSIAHYRVILADKTVETKVHRAFNRHRNNLQALNDGDLNPFS